MSSGLMQTDAGGENRQYEGNLGLTDPHKTSSGQLSSSSDEHTTTDPSATPEGKQAGADRGAQTAENIRYGQGISEGGMGGTTTEGSGDAAQEGLGKQAAQASDNADAVSSRQASGYGGDQDQDTGIGG